MSKIVGIIGFINSGKNTVAEILVNKHGFIQDSFAASLKDACATIFDWPRHLLEGDTAESRLWRETQDNWWANKLGIPDFTPRVALQIMGTEVIRDNFNKDIWFLTLENRVRKQRDKNVVISDVRFPNEIKFIKNNGGILIRVMRGNIPEWYDYALKANFGDKFSENIMKTSYKHVHPSEWSLVGHSADYEICNNGTLSDLEKSTKNIVELIL